MEAKQLDPIAPFRAELRNACRDYEAEQTLFRTKAEEHAAADTMVRVFLERLHDFDYEDAMNEHNTQANRIYRALKVLQVAQAEGPDAALLWKLAN